LRDRIDPQVVLGSLGRIGNARSNVLRPPFTERGALRFLVPVDSYPIRLGGSIAALLRFGGRVSSPALAANYFLRHSLPRSSGSSLRSAAGSLLLHCSLVALLVYMSPRIVAESPAVQDAFHHEIIYYRIPLREDVKVPQLGARQRGDPYYSRPAHTAEPAASPAAPTRATVATIFSRPAHPDNARQTIYQSVSPPDLKIKTEQPLPNIVVVSTPEKPKFALAPQYSRPSAVERSVDNETSPTIPDMNSQEPLRVITNSADNLLPAPSSPVTHGARPGPEADAADLVIVGVDPSNSASELALPPGNRWGDFSIGPPRPGSSPGGGSSSSANGASKGAGSGPGGNGEARGSGGKNGESDRGDSAISSPVAIAGSGNERIAGGVLTQLPPGMIYPVVQPLGGIRKNTMVIAAGPMGGGGLRVYGALSCASIYSIFLPMPGKNWSLQYCEVSSGNTKATTEIHPSAIHLDKPLIPPDVDLNRRFDFKRTPLPGPKTDHLIILKGVIATDGTVQNLAVYQGVSAELDKAAEAAFSQWHFKPAMRDGRAVEVQILVGIPPVTGE
jgi:Gram-negative bacterial TonB protein C-terminal